MAARSHSLVFVVVISDTAEGQFPPIYQDRFGTHFRGKICWKAFSRKKVPKSGDRHGARNSPTTASLRSHLPKAFPSAGEGTPVRTLGRMRGRSCTQPFLVEKRGTPAYRPNGIFLLPRWATPVAPSSVTFGDSFPPRGKPLGCAALHEKSAPNQGTYMGTVPAPLPFRCAPPRQNERVGTSGP